MDTSMEEAGMQGASMEEAGMEIDCQTCPARGAHCDDCVVSFLLGPPELQEDERRAVSVLASRGLIPPLQDPRPGSTATSGREGPRLRRLRSA